MTTITSQAGQTTVRTFASSTAEQAVQTNPTAKEQPASPPSGDSAGKDFTTVAKDARSILDASAKAAGKKFSINSNFQEWQTTFAGMDRRSLFAVAGNKDGAFSKDEQEAASFLMFKQEEAVMKTAGDHASGFKAMVEFLDSVSPEEKTSVKWAFSRASAQQSYEDVVTSEGGAPERIDSESPLVKVIKAALQASKSDPEKNKITGPGTTIEDLEKQPWAKGFEQQLEQAYYSSTRSGSLLDLNA